MISSRLDRPVQKIDTLIVGGGQAGLATSYWLKQHGREHLVLEQGRAGPGTPGASAGTASPW